MLQAALDTKHKMVATEKLTLIHFNDVYNVESAEKQEPVGGAARMRTAIKKYSDRNPLILFSGDCFAPSICKHSTFLFCLLQDHKNILICFFRAFSDKLDTTFSHSHCKITSITYHHLIFHDKNMIRVYCKTKTQVCWT